MTFTIKIADGDYAKLHRHLFQEDQDEHAALLLAGFHATSSKTVLLVREVHPLPEEQFPPGKFGYRQIAPRSVAEIAGRAGAEGLAYVSAHSHPGARDHVALSSDDVEAHRRLFPHLLDLTGGNPVAGVVLGQRSAAGEVWSRGSQPAPLDALDVVGAELRRLTSAPEVRSDVASRFDRQARLFGSDGQRLLARSKVAVIGAGGGGSMIVEQLAHLGVGEITVVDFDTVQEVNLSRIVGATQADARANSSKVDVAARLIRRIDPSIRVNPIEGDVADLWVAEQLRDHDFVFLATDTATSRLVFNALVHQYLIPGVQVGAKVELAADTTRIEQVYVAVRPVLPLAGCLYCNQLIDPDALQREAASDAERAAQNYLGTPDVVDPSVISLNGIATSHAVNAMLFFLTGLAEPGLLEHRLFFLQTGDSLAVRDRRDPDCPFCGRSRSSRYAAGDPSTQLPCRISHRSSEQRPRPTVGRLRSWRRLLGRVGT